MARALLTPATITMDAMFLTFHLTPIGRSRRPHGTASYLRRLILQKVNAVQLPLNNGAFNSVACKGIVRSVNRSKKTAGNSSLLVTLLL